MKARTQEHGMHGNKKVKFGSGSVRWSTTIYIKQGQTYIRFCIRVGEAMR